MKKYEAGKHLEYFRGLIESGAKIEEVCHEIIIGLGVDDDTSELVSKSSTIEAELFSLAVYCEDPGYKDEQAKNYQKILDLLGVSSPKE